MTNKLISQTQPIGNTAPAMEPYEEYLTPEQRVAIIADILSTIAVRIMRKRYESAEQNPLQDNA